MVGSQFWVLFVTIFLDIPGPHRGRILVPTFRRVNRIYSTRAETMVDGLPRAFRLFVAIRGVIGDF